MDPKSLNANPFIGKTDRIRRPEPATYRGPHEAMVRDQAAWDFAKAHADDNARRQQDRIATVDAERERRRHADRAQRDADRLEPARVAFVANGGTAEQWNQRKDAIAAEIAERAAGEAATGRTADRERLRRTGAYSL